MLMMQSNRRDSLEGYPINNTIPKPTTVYEHDQKHNHVYNHSHKQNNQHKNNNSIPNFNPNSDTISDEGIKGNSLNKGKLTMHELRDRLHKRRMLGNVQGRGDKNNRDFVIYRAIDNKQEEENNGTKSKEYYIQGRFTLFL